MNVLTWSNNGPGDPALDEESSSPLSLPTYQTWDREKSFVFLYILFPKYALF